MTYSFGGGCNRFSYIDQTSSAEPCLSCAVPFTLCSIPRVYYFYSNVSEGDSVEACLRSVIFVCYYDADDEKYLRALLFHLFSGRVWLAFEWCVPGRRDIFTLVISCSFCFKHFNVVLYGTEEIWQIFVLDCSLLFYFSNVAFLITLFLYPQPTPSSFARPPCLVSSIFCTCQGFGLESFIPINRWVLSIHI